jgi:hypothetical protein
MKLTMWKRFSKLRSGIEIALRRLSYPPASPNLFTIATKKWDLQEYRSTAKIF